MKRQAKLETKQQQELRDTNEQLEQESKQSLKSIEEQMDSQKEHLLSKEERAFEKEMLLKKKQMSEDESREIMEQHRANVRLYITQWHR